MGYQNGGFTGSQLHLGGPMAITKYSTNNSKSLKRFVTGNTHEFDDF
jgi:hypothetical protein